LRDVTYLTRRDGVYYARIDVPLDLVTILKTKTRKLSLKTKDKAEAKRLLWPVISKWQREFDDLRARRTLVAADRQFAVWEHYTAALDRDEAERAATPGQADLDRITTKLVARADNGEIATFADNKSKGWGKLVTVKDPAGVMHEIPVYNELLDGPQQKVLAQLATLGLKVGSDAKSKKLLIELLKSTDPRKHMTSVKQTGWVGDDFLAFSLGKTTLGERAVLPLSRGGDQRHPTLISQESVETWRTQLGEKCRGNAMMVLAVSLAFSAPLLGLMSMDGGGLHFRGQSSSGKSTLLRLAASVWGSPDLVSTWRATSNGLEALTGSHNDLLLLLDEIGEITPRQLNEAIYMLSNGKAKVRMTRDRDLGEAATWRLALISSGELSVKEHLSSANLETREGQEVRLIDIEADTRAHGVFDEIHGATDPGQFAGSIQTAAAASFGTVGRSFLEKLIKVWKSKEFRVLLRRKVDEYQKDLLSSLSKSPDSMAGRVAKRFALIGLSGELATQWGLKGWAKGEAKEAVIEAFRNWHDRWIGDDTEAAQGPMHKLKEYLVANAGKLVDPETFTKDMTKPGFLHDAKVYLTEDSWRSLFPGSAGQEAARQLAACRVLARGDGRHLQRKGPRSILGRPRFYAIDPKQLDALVTN
jgi:putative DNA primase/helicase